MRHAGRIALVLLIPMGTVSLGRGQESDALLDASVIVTHTSLPYTELLDFDGDGFVDTIASISVAYSSYTVRTAWVNRGTGSGLWG